MKRYGTLALAALIGVVFDAALFAGTAAPRLLLATALAACVVLNMQSALVVAFLGGLAVDALANAYLGLTATCHLLSVCVLWLLIRKNNPKLFVLALYACLAALAPAPIEWLYAYLLGAHALANGWNAVLSRVLPSVLLTGAATMPLVFLLRLAKKGHRDRI